MSRNDLLIYLIDNWQYYKTDTNNLSYKQKILFLFISFSNSDIIYVAYLHVLEILLYVDDKQLKKVNYITQVYLYFPVTESLIKEKEVKFKEILFSLHVHLKLPVQSVPIYSPLMLFV